MTLGKLVDNNPTLFIFYFYSNDDPRDPENRRQNPFSECRFLEQTSYNRLNGKAWLTAVVRLSVNIPTLVSVDLIGEKNQVILELLFNVTFNDISVNTCDGTQMCRRTEEEVGPTVRLPRHRHFLGLLNVSIQAPTWGQPFYGYSEKPPYFSRLLWQAWG